MLDQIGLGNATAEVNAARVSKDDTNHHSETPSDTLQAIEPLINPNLQPASQHIGRFSDGQQMRTVVRCTNGMHFSLINSATSEKATSLKFSSRAWIEHPNKPGMFKNIHGLGGYSRVRSAEEVTSKTVVAVRKTTDLSQAHLYGQKYGLPSNRPLPVPVQNTAVIRDEIAGLNLIAQHIPKSDMGYFVTSFGGVWVDVLKQDVPGNDVPMCEEAMLPEHVNRTEARYSQPSSKLYVFQELITGGDFGSGTESLPSPAINSWKSQADIALNFLRPVAVLHRHGLRHLDIKPENFLRTVNNRAKLCDYGFVTNQTLKNVNCGTPGFIAPECFQNEHEKIPVDTAKVDSFALGVTLFQWMTGFHPCEVFFPAPMNSKFTYALANSESFKQASDMAAQRFDRFERLSPLTVAQFMMHPDPDKRASVELATLLMGAM